MRVHNSDTITLLYLTEYNDSPSTKFVFALFLNAKTSMLRTVDKDPGPPYKRMARAGSLTSRPGSSTLSREKRATSMPFGKWAPLEHPFPRSRGWLSRWPGMISHLVSRWSWPDR